jgi:hypothetical protein
VSWSSGMVKHKRDLSSIPTSDPSRAELSPGSSPDAYSVAAYQEDRSWIEATAAVLSLAPSPGRGCSPRHAPLGKASYRWPFTDHLSRRIGTLVLAPPPSRGHSTLRSFGRQSEFSYEELLCLSVLFAPLYGELASVTRQRMIVRN